MRSGGRLSDALERLGDYRAVKRGCYRWIEMGVLDATLDVLTCEADMEWMMIDSTIVRARQHAADKGQQKGGRCPSLGRSREGLCAKIHAAEDALGNSPH